jgi:glutathione S-transferase
VSILLGDKSFLLGDKPSTIDCTLFGHLVQFLYVPLDFPQKAFLRKECPNLVEYVDRMKRTFWPDWDEMCDVKCMRGKLGLENSMAKIKTS